MRTERFTEHLPVQLIEAARRKYILRDVAHWDQLGLTTTDAIRIFLHQVRLHKGLPFDLRLKEDNSEVLLPVAIRQSALDAVYDD